MQVVILEPGYRSGSHSLVLNGLASDIVEWVGFVCNLCAGGLDRFILFTIASSQRSLLTLTSHCNCVFEVMPISNHTPTPQNLITSSQKKERIFSKSYTPLPFSDPGVFLKPVEIHTLLMCSEPHSYTTENRFIVPSPFLVSLGISTHDPSRSINTWWRCQGLICFSYWSLIRFSVILIWIMQTNTKERFAKCTCSSENKWDERSSWFWHKTCFTS